MSVYDVRKEIASNKTTKIEGQPAKMQPSVKRENFAPDESKNSTLDKKSAKALDNTKYPTPLTDGRRLYEPPQYPLEQEPDVQDPYLEQKLAGRQVNPSYPGERR